MNAAQYDIISDLHGDHDRMAGLLEGLGYDLDTHLHPDGHMAVFLGDFIDRGRQNLAVVDRMQAMRNAGSAFAIMGNHELNMLLLHADGPDGDGLRKRSEQNLHQHEAFLRECPLGSVRAKEMRSIFHSLPLFIDFGGFRVVHAFWSDDAVRDLLRARPDACLRPEDLPEVAQEYDGGPLGAAVTALAKGPEVTLPEGAWYLDNGGTRRDKSRMRWWQPAERLHDALVAVPDMTHIPDGPVPDICRQFRYSAAAPPVIFGHYQLRDTPALGPNYLCLDIPSKPLAYSWRGEGELKADHLRDLDGLRSGLSLSSDDGPDRARSGMEMPAL